MNYLNFALTITGAVLLSPIGTALIVRHFDLDFIQACYVMTGQCACFMCIATVAQPQNDR
ncbi:hypothetical protein EBZ39_02870 [bacterium]|nr:hypothetical protein [bacterium]